MKKFYVWKSKRFHAGWAVRHLDQFAPFPGNRDGHDAATELVKELLEMQSPDAQQRYWMGWARCYVKSGKLVT